MPSLDAASDVGDARSPDANVSDAAIPDAPDASVPDAGMPDASPPCGDLRLWYRFEETNGMTRDSSGCSNAGTPAGVTRGEIGKIGNAYRFNVPPAISTAHVLVPDAPTLSDLGTLTARDPALTLGYYPSCDGMGSVPSYVTLPLDAWTHIAVTYNSSTGEVLFYQDGVQSASGTGYMNMGHMCDNAEPMIVGGIDTAGFWGWEGWIDELRVWAVLRTQAEICADAGGTPGPGTCALPP